MTDLVDVHEVLRELNAMFQGMTIRREDEMAAMIKAVCHERGIEVDEVTWEDGDWGRRANIKITPKLGEVFMTIRRDSLR